MEQGYTGTASIDFIANINVFGQGLDLQGEPYPEKVPLEGHSSANQSSLLWQTWGRGINDTHFINEQPTRRKPTDPMVYDWVNGTGVVTQTHVNAYSSSVPGPRGERPTGSFNVDMYNNFDFIYNTIGEDPEYISGSISRVSCSDAVGDLIHRECEDHFIDYMKYQNHLNTRIVNPEFGPDKDKYQYKNYIADTTHTTTGRVAGRTAFITASDDTIIYPNNHWINYPNLADPESGQLRHLFYVGSRGKFYSNTVAIEHGPTPRGSSSAQFGPSIHDQFPDKQVYSITVEGADTDNVLRVETKENRPKKNRKR